MVTTTRFRGVDFITRLGVGVGEGVIEVSHCLMVISATTARVFFEESQNAKLRHTRTRSGNTLFEQGFALFRAFSRVFRVLKAIFAISEHHKRLVVSEDAMLRPLHPKFRLKIP